MKKHLIKPLQSTKPQPAFASIINSAPLKPIHNILWFLIRETHYIASGLTSLVADTLFIMYPANALPVINAQRQYPLLLATTDTANSRAASVFRAAADTTLSAHYVRRYKLR